MSFQQGFVQQNIRRNPKSSAGIVLGLLLLLVVLGLLIVGALTNWFGLVSNETTKKTVTNDNANGNNDTNENNKPDENNKTDEKPDTDKPNGVDSENSLKYGQNIKLLNLYKTGKGFAENESFLTGGRGLGNVGVTTEKDCNAQVSCTLWKIEKVDSQKVGTQVKIGDRVLLKSVFNDRLLTGHRMGKNQVALDTSCVNCELIVTDGYQQKKSFGATLEQGDIIRFESAAATIGNKQLSFLTGARGEKNVGTSTQVTPDCKPGSKCVADWKILFQ